MTNNVKIVSAIATSAVIGTCLLFGCGITVTPEKPEVVKEGFSGQKKPVVETKNEFTGSHHATTNPEPQEVVKEGYSGTSSKW